MNFAGLLTNFESLKIVLHSDIAIDCCIMTCNNNNNNNNNNSDKAHIHSQKSAHVARVSTGRQREGVFSTP